LSLQAQVSSMIAASHAVTHKNFLVFLIAVCF